MRSENLHRISDLIPHYQGYYASVTMKCSKKSGFSHPEYFSVEALAGNVTTPRVIPRKWQKNIRPYEPTLM